MVVAGERGLSKGMRRQTSSKGGFFGFLKFKNNFEEMGTRLGKTEL